MDMDGNRVDKVMVCEKAPELPPAEVTKEVAKAETKEIAKTENQEPATVEPAAVNEATKADPPEKPDA